ncbi:UNVERIFIED_ORG: hypothetical protein J2Y78_003820 [Buttiauxella agrestis ATCC 33320]
MKEGLTIGQLSEINAELHTEIAALKKERDALAVENSTIKTMNDCLAEELRGYESDGAFDGPDMHKLWHSHAGALPATDAAIASIQAHGVDRLADHLSGLNIMASETSVREFAAQIRKEPNHD